MMIRNLVASAAVAMFAFQASPVDAHFRVNANGLNLRTGPGTGYRTIRTLPRNTLVCYWGSSGVWKKVIKINLQSASGWVHGGYLSSSTSSGGSSSSSSSSSSVAGTFYGTAYKYGRAYTIALVRIDGKAVAAKSAGPFLSMRGAAARSGVRIYIVSGFRTMSEQIALYRRYGSPRAARPGYSNHQSGTAFDLNTAGFYGSVYNWLTRNGWRDSFKRTVSFEPWHWEYMR